MAQIQPVDSPPERTPSQRRVLGREVVLVLAVSLGASAAYAVLSIINKLTAQVSLSQQQATLNASATPDRPWLDLAYQLLGIAVALAPAALAIHLLGRDAESPWRQIGLDRQRPRFDLGMGCALALVICVPGLGLYLAARAIGINATVVPAALAEVWWAIPVLILAAVQNALVEEIIVVGYLSVRLGQLGWSWPAILTSSAILRGSYHLYQGFGGFIGNLVMGVLFYWVYRRWGRIGPLVVTHTLLDVGAFVGYSLLHGHVSWLP